MKNANYSGSTAEDLVIISDKNIPILITNI